MRPRILTLCKFLLLAVSAASVGLSCGHTPPQDKPLATTSIPPSTPKLTVASRDFTAGAPLPSASVQSCPELQWANLPREAKALALIVEDPDAPGAQPFTHFLLANYPANQPALSSTQLKGALVGMNDAGTTGYYGPHPSKGSGVHHYHFEVFVLKQPLNLKPGFSRAELEAAMQGQVLASGEVVGTYGA